MRGSSQKRSGAFGLALAAAVALGGCTASPGGRPDEQTPKITARGTGRVTGTPDTVVMTLGVESESAQATEALAATNQKARAIIDMLKQAGIAEEDIKTSQFSINPRFDDEGRAITGYLVNNLLTVRASQQTDPGALIDKAAQAAGNDIRVQSVAFEVDDKGDLYADARAEAVREARTQAEQLARAAGVELGDVQSITETPTPPFPLIPRTGGGADVPLQAGTQEITLQVEVVYEISN